MIFEFLKNMLWFLAGLGLFIYGLQTMANGLQKVAGSKTKKMLAMLTSNRLSGILVGALVTAIIQSSSATTVMVVGFVNAQIMNLVQAVGVIMGANIGTTVTAWFVSMPEWGSIFHPEFFATTLVIIGTVMMLFNHEKTAKEISNILIGFGIIFVGLFFMSNTIAVYGHNPTAVQFFIQLGKSPWLALLIGAAITALIQSSSASMGILQMLALNGVVNWQAAAFIILGQNIGTCFTALLSCIGANKNAQRAAVIHLLFNVFGAVLVGSIAYAYFAMMPSIATMKVNCISLAIFHTCFNVITTLVLFPFSTYLVDLSKKIIPDAESEEKKMLVKLDERLLQTPGFALAAVRQEINKMGQLALKNVEYARNTVLKQKGQDALRTNQEKIKVYGHEISHFLGLLDTNHLTMLEQLKLKHSILCLGDIELIGEHCEEIINTYEDWMINKKFSQEALEDIDSIYLQAYNALKYTLEMRISKDLSLNEKIQEYIQNVRQLEQKMREGHTQRLLQKKCNVETGLTFLDILNNFGRIADQSEVIAGYTLDEEREN